MGKSPRVVGHYELLDELGQGGVGRVYHAIDNTLGRAVAVKILQDPDPRARERFYKEAKVLAQLEHPCIVNIYEVGSFDEGGVTKPFIVMPWLRGVTLDEMTKTSGPLPLSKVVEIASQLSGALEFLSASRVAHRDITPSNIFIQDGAPIRLIDFGRTSVLDQGEMQTVRNDIFALAAVCYEALGGNLKDSSLPGRLLHQVNTAISERVSRVIQLGMAEEPDERFQSAADFAQSLRDAANDQARDELRKYKEYRYHALVDKRFLEGLASEEREELDSLFHELSQFDEEFYGPLLQGLRQQEENPKT